MAKRRGSGRWKYSTAAQTIAIQWILMLRADMNEEDGKFTN